jgi:hypothetical protein
MIRILHTPQKPDPLVRLVPPPNSAEDLYGSLNSAQADQLMQLAAREMKNGNTDFAEDIAKSLATLTNFSLDPLLETWLDEDHLWPSVIFRGAGSAVRDRLLARMSKISGTLNINHALCALAWIGDDKVCETFLNWEKTPPSWRRQLHVGPGRYAHVAGWEPTENGRRDLHHKTCLAIQPVVPGEVDCKSVVLVREFSETCRWCETHLVGLLELDLSDPQFAFLGFSDPDFAILTCEACTCFGNVFGRIDQAGEARWFDGNHRPKWLPDDVASWPRGPWSGIKVRLTPRPPIRAVDWCMPVTTSQIGGLPCWIQDAEYPSCPNCQKTMTFVAQLDNGHFSGYEGIYYAFLCANCRITATSYQQS